MFHAVRLESAYDVLVVFRCVLLAELCCVVLISLAQCLAWNNVVMIAIIAGL